MKKREIVQLAVSKALKSLQSKHFNNQKEFLKLFPIFLPLKTFHFKLVQRWIFLSHREIVRRHTTKKYYNEAAPKKDTFEIFFNNLF